MLILVILAVVLATFYGIYVSVIKKKNKNRTLMCAASLG